ncbi:hypothetical protein RJ640_009594 [Escallonia rubra]|uniref:Pmr5/Cas1p GDSL/SGNH-like acyl-esterase family protein n=1 Tax=Escallonia rubra TaxID=112253 RepID=A0AA88SCT6_9ASTE|nr:hypothetical protein RJ640_009594 [Escallonia rubra]
MFGAVQLGLLAACIVLFVPMGMAGWHLSRNKVLFFSGALFITLAVGVHLTPYFPSLSSYLSSLPPETFVPDRTSCIPLLHQIEYNASNLGGSWSWDDSGPVSACGFEKLGRTDASDLLNGSWVVVAGDSQARLQVLSLLNLILGPDEMGSVRVDLFKRHSDYQIMVDETGTKLDFVWAPYVTNLTDLVMKFKADKNYPDVLVMGAGLWDMLHITNSSDFGVSLRLLRDSLDSWLPISTEFGTDGPVTGSVSIRSPHLFWLGMPMLINTMLNTEEKREKMSDDLRSDYDKELYRSRLLRQSGGPLLLLDIESLSRKCGAGCTMDGMHYEAAVYETSVHIMLNALLIESHQKL